MASQRARSATPDSLMIEIDFSNDDEWPVLNREAINTRPPPPPPLPSSSNPSQENRADGGGLNGLGEIGRALPIPVRRDRPGVAVLERNANLAPPLPPPPPSPERRNNENFHPPQAANVPPPPPPQRRFADQVQPPQAANVPPPPPPQRRFADQVQPPQAAPGPARHARAGQAARRQRVYDPQMRLVNLLYKLANPYRGHRRNRENIQDGGEPGDQGGGGNPGDVGADENA